MDVGGAGRLSALSILFASRQAARALAVLLAIRNIFQSCFYSTANTLAQY